MRKNFKNPVEWIKDLVKDTKEDIKKGINKAVYLPLLPFLPLMKRALAKSGYNSSGDLQEVSERFYNEYMRNLSYDYKYIQAFNKTNAGHHFDPLTVTQIANEVLPIIRQLLEMFKKSDNAADRQSVEDSNNIITELETENNQGENNQGENNEDKNIFMQYLPFIIGALALVLVLNTSKSKK